MFETSRHPGPLYRKRRLIILALAFTLLACSADHSPTGLQGPPQNELASSVEVTPASLQIGPDETGQFTAIVKSSKGRRVTGQPVQWVSSDPDVVAIDETGRVTGVNEGTATVRASAGAKSAGAQVEVRGHVVAIRINREEIRTTEGQEEQLGAIVTYRNGAQRSVARVEWSTEDPAIASVDSDGLLVARKRGSTRVWARAWGREGNARVDVEGAVVNSVEIRYPSPQLEVGQQMQAWADVRSEGGTRLTSMPLQWFSSDPDVATVDGNGVVTGVAVGEVTLTARAQHVESSGEVEIVPVGAVDGERQDSGEGFPVPDAPGQVTDLSATAIGSSAVRLAFTEVENGVGEPASYVVRYSETPINWGNAWNVRKGSCVPPVEGEETGKRLQCTVEGLRPRTEYGFQVVAYRETASGETAFGAPSGPVAATTPHVRPVLSVTPASLTLSVGQRRTLDARVTDEFGNPLDRPVSWSSLDASVASVDDGGRVEGLRGGSTSIRATTEGADQSVPVTVSAPLGREDGDGGDPTGGSGSDGGSSDNGSSDGGSRDRDSGSGSGGGASPSPPADVDGLPAFEGARGYGALALDGCDRRNLEVMEVTTLAASGAGSLQDAIDRSRSDRLSVVIFRVAGEITGRFRIKRRDCLYVAGQTAPGSGVTLRSPRGHGGTVLSIGRSEDVVLRYLRIRAGKGEPGRGDDLSIGPGSHRVVLDHLSLQFSNDELIGLNANQPEPITDLTLQHSLLAAALRRHSTAFLITVNDEASRVEGLSIHRNLFAHNAHRNPRVSPKVGTATVEFVNNVVYNWRGNAGSAMGGATVDFVGNYFKAGPWSEKARQVLVYWTGLPGRAKPPFKASIYMEGNIAEDGEIWAPPADQFALWTLKDQDGSKRALDDEIKRYAPQPGPGSFAVPQESASRAYATVLGDVGANHRLDCRGRFVPALDRLDASIVEHVRSGGGPRVDEENDHQDDYGGFPPVDPGTPCADADADGMPDQYEVDMGFDPGDASDAGGDRDGNGYTNLEDFLSGS